jgi:hypothetical protein
MIPGRILFYVVMIIQWVVVYQSEQNDHRRDQRACALYLCYAHPSVRLWFRLLWALCRLPCSG